MKLLSRCVAMLAVAMTVTATGCQGEPDSAATEPAAATNQTAHDETAHDHDHADENHADHGAHNDGAADHSGWWCKEHGVPEGECPRCDTSLLAEFKTEGDWCDEHNRPDSQCFVCDPERFEKFAARYEARFGEPPPQPTE